MDVVSFLGMFRYNRINSYYGHYLKGGWKDEVSFINGGYCCIYGVFFYFRIRIKTGNAKKTTIKETQTVKGRAFLPFAFFLKESKNIKLKCSSHLEDLNV
jgi:hypothetical protein